MSVYLFAYRDWAFRLGHDLENEITGVITTQECFEDAQNWFSYYDRYNEKEIQEVPVWTVDPKNLATIRSMFKSEDVLLFYGWSWMVPACFTDELLCICLHPSPLPKYRGGSPIQNQVLAGETTSAVTLFKMGQGLDDGPIFGQREISLKGSLDKIFDEIYRAGWEITKELLSQHESNTLVFVPQDESKATFCKRRKPSESQILPTDTAKDIYDKVRCLQNPYPNAYIVSADGKKVFIKMVDYER